MDRALTVLGTYNVTVTKTNAGTTLSSLVTTIPKRLRRIQLRSTSTGVYVGIGATVSTTEAIIPITNCLVMDVSPQTAANMKFNADSSLALHIIMEGFVDPVSQT
jgi:hypothetical protein